LEENHVCRPAEGKKKVRTYVPGGFVPICSNLRKAKGRENYSDCRIYQKKSAISYIAIEETMKENLMGLSGAMMQVTEQNAVYQDFEVLLEDIDLLCQKEKLFLPLTNIPIWLHPIRQSHPCYRNTLTLAGKTPICS
jgi:hypothetical protein